MKKIRRPITVPTYEEIEIYTKQELQNTFLVKLFNGVNWSVEKEKQVIKALDNFDRVDILYLCQLLDLVPFNAEMEN